MCCRVLLCPTPKDLNLAWESGRGPTCSGFGVVVVVVVVEWYHTRQPENSKRAHLRVPALQTPPKFHEKAPRDTETAKRWWEKEEKARNFGSWPTLANPTLANRVWPALTGGRLWPIRLWPALVFQWYGRLWPKPTLAKTDFGQSDFGQTDFDFFFCVFVCVCVFMCVCVHVCVCFCVCLCVLVSRFPCGGFKVFVWS